MGLLRRLIVVIACSALVVGLTPGAAFAWKPFTHNFTGQQVQADLNNDHAVDIGGHSYPVNSAVDDAIRNWPAYYNAGVIGPDGFPDIAFGQATIHPGDPASTGSWLGYLLQQAWASQSPTSGYDEPGERAQILAFTYGYLTHAAGDMWAHTLMNDYSGGIFPSVKEVLTKLPAAKIALRHLVAEGYIGTATQGWDTANADDSVAGCASPDTSPPDTTCDPGGAGEKAVEVSRVCADSSSPPNAATTCTTVGPGGSHPVDFSSDASPGIEFAAPIRFVQNAMVNLSAHPPTDGCDHNGDGDPGCPNGNYAAYVGGATSQLTRGVILDVILDQEAKLQVYAAKTRFDASHLLCATIDPDCSTTTTTLHVNTVRGVASVEVEDTICDAEVFCLGNVADGASDLIDGLLADYAEHWIDDIDALRDHWTDFALAVTKAMFDPQTKRDAANDKCSFGSVGAEGLTNNARNACEAGISTIDVVLYSLGHVYSTGNPSWIDRYLLPALGLPDFVGDIDGFLTTVGDAISDMFTFIGVSNPIAQITADVNAFIHDKLNEWVQSEFGISPAAISDFAKSPNRWMCGSDASNPASLTLPGLGTVTPGGLFTPAEHARLDGLMGLPAGHHESEAGLPEDCSPLATDAKLNKETFAPLKNTITLGKMLLLDGPGLNSVMHDTLVDEGVIKSTATVSTYGGTSAGFPANVMVDGLDATTHAASHTNEFGGLSRTLPWLQLIDGDHAWRENGLPRFCDNDGSGGCAGAVPAGLSPQPRAIPGPGQNNLLGQNNGGNGNMPMFDSCLLRPAFQSLFTDWENPGENFPALGDEVSPDASAPNAPSVGYAVAGAFTSGTTTYVGGANQVTLTTTDSVFTDDNVKLRYRVFPSGSTPGAEDGWQALAGGGHFAVTGADGAYRIEYQAQNPCHTFNPDDALASPIGHRDVVLDTTGPSITISSPAPQGRVFNTAETSAISYSVTDAASGVGTHSVTLDGAPSSNGATLDMFFLTPGTHTIVVTAADNLGNASTATRTFRVEATAASLLANLDRARAMGLVPGTTAYTGLRDKLVAALAAHQRGQHPTEWNQLAAFINLLLAQRGTGIDAVTANRFIAYAQDIVARQA
jgi:hypothetical protein